MTAETLALIFVACAAVPATLFVALYASWAPWWRSAEGRHLLTFTADLAALLDLALLRRWIGDHSWLTVCFVTLYAVMAGQLWWRFALLLRHHRRDAIAARSSEPRKGDA